MIDHEVVQLISWATLVLSLSCWILYTHLRVWRIISPFGVLLLLLAAIFGLRPLLMLAQRDFYFYGLSIASGVTQAALVGLVATIFVRLS